MKMYIGEVLRYDQASHNLVIQRMVDHLGAKGWLALNTGVVFPSAEYAGGGLFSAHRLGKMMWLPLLNVFQRSAYVQDQVIQARIALALERCFLAKREYPEKLEALTPDYLTQVPKEALTGRSMHYVRNAPNQYLLWADGWDGKDDHARPSERGKIGEGDWVWGKY